MKSSVVHVWTPMFDEMQIQNLNHLKHYAGIVIANVVRLCLCSVSTSIFCSKQNIIQTLIVVSLKLFI